MAYVTDEMIKEMEERYGKPRYLSMTYEISRSEMDMVRSSQKHGRNHDITMFIFRDRSYNEFAAISKHMFPPGVFRAPSGAAEPGESLEDGARREAMEETGLEIELNRFILFINVRFTCGPETLDWRSLVFTAFCIGGKLGQLDFVEIRDTTWLTIDELQNSIRQMLLDTEMGLFAYRVALHDESVEEINKLPL